MAWGSAILLKDTQISPVLSSPFVASLPKRQFPGNVPPWPTAVLRVLWVIGFFRLKRHTLSICKIINCTDIHTALTKSEMNFDTHIFTNDISLAHCYPVISWLPDSIIYEWGYLEYHSTASINYIPNETFFHRVTLIYAEPPRFVNTIGKVTGNQVWLPPIVCWFTIVWSIYHTTGCIWIFCHKTFNLTLISFSSWYTSRTSGGNELRSEECIDEKDAEPGKLGPVQANE